MTKLSTTLLQSAGVLAVGAVLIAGPMFAFAHSNADNSSQDGSVRTVAISDNGSVLVRGAKVTSVNDGVITAKTTWNNLAVTWTVRTDNNTDLIRIDGSNASVGEMSVGDYVSFSGALATDHSDFVVNADTVRDWTLAGTNTTGDKDNDDHEAGKGFWGHWNVHLPVFNFFGHAGMHK